MRVKLLFCFILFCFLSSIAEASSGCSIDQGVKNCKGLSLTKIPDTIEENVRTLDLSKNKIKNVTTIPETSSLLHLNLSSNGITTLMYTAFDNLDNLEILILSHNKLDKITDDIFEWNPLKLQVLLLDNNNLEFIQHFLLYDLEELTELDLHNNNITFIHAHAFAHLVKLTHLRLNGNNLFTFDHKWISGLKSNLMQELSLVNNPWSCDCAMASHHKWMHGAQWFRTLVDSQNFECESPANLKGSSVLSVTLEQMNETCNLPTISQISQDSNIPMCSTIELQCIVTGIPHPSITWTAPNHDHYSFHTADRFKGVEAYQNGTLIVHQFKTEDFGTYICTATNVKGSRQVNTTVKMKGHAHTCTTETSLSNNPDEKQVTSEDTVEKHHSKECPAGCTCLSLNTDCTGDGQNQLQAVPRGMPNDSTSVSLASNHITSISATDFQNLTKMTELRLDNSHITTIDERAFLTTVNLTTLTMRDNKLAKLPENIFKNLKKLSILVLDNNELEKISAKWLQPLKKLQWLYIRNNKITMIEQHAFAGLVAIRFIHMENNRISTLHIDTVKDLTEKDTCTIQKMFLVGNPINCPCDMKDLQAYLEKNKKRLRTLFGDGIQCQFPADLDGQYLKDVPKNYKCNRVQTDVKVIYEAKPSGGAMTGLWFGGLVIGIILCIALFIVWKKRGCNFRPHSMSYRNIPGNDEVEEHRSLTTDNYGNGSEAFV